MTTPRTTDLGRGLCLGGAGLGLIGLIGWLTGREALVAIASGQPPMMPNTAIALLLLGAAGALCGFKSSASAARLSALLAIFVLLIGLVTLAEYGLDLPFSIDQLVIVSEVGPYPGRPSPPTALALVFLAAALLLWNWRLAAPISAAEWLILFAGAIAFTALLGQAFGAGALYRVVAAPIGGVAPHTAIGLLLIAAGLLLERPGSRLAQIASSSSPGDIVLRQLALAFVLMSVGIGASGALLFQVLGGENAALIAASLTVVGIAVGLSLLAVTARKLNRAHKALEQSRQAARDLIEQAAEGVFISDLEGRFTDVNSVGCRMAGYSREEILTKAIADLVPPDDLERLRSHRAQLLEGHADIGEWLLRRKDGSFLPVEVSAKILPDGRWLAFSRDISERKRAEEARRESEERLRRVSDNADVGLTRCTRDWYYLSANPAYAEIVGKSHDRIVGRSIVEVMGAEAAETIRPYVERVLRGEHVTYEAQVPFSGGGPRYLQVSYTPDLNAAGEIVGWVGCITDVTARRRAEESLRLSEAKFSGIVSVSADAIITVDEDHKITLFNESAEQVFGRSKAEVIGASLDILLPERFRSAHARHVKDFEASPETTRRVAARRSEIFGLRSNGEEFPAEASISKMVVGGKRFLTVVLRDISERKRIEGEQQLLAELGSLLAERLEFEERLTQIAQLLARNLADVCIVDVIDDDGRLRRAKVACRVTNREWLCDVLMRQTPGDTRAGLANLDSESGKALVIRNVTPDIIGSWARNQEDRAVLEAAGIRSAIVVPLIARGMARGFVVLLSLSRPFVEADLRVVEDVTQRAALILDNARLFAAATRAIQARDDLLGVVAHDLRNPLAAIASLAAVLEAKKTEGEIAEELAAAANRMNRLIADLLDVTRMEAGHLSLKQERLPAGEVIADALEGQTPLASAASLELRLETAPYLPDVWADRDRLLQVFENLIGNAVKFTEPGGRITLGAVERQGEVIFSVSDTGCGIADTYLPHVFDRFWQVPGTERRGMGFGLAIVKGIVEAHGGRIWVQSAPGQGTTFFFTMPGAVAQPTAA